MSLLGGSNYESRIAYLEAAQKASKDAHQALLTAFDKFFDAVAEDLGYEAAKMIVMGHYVPHKATSSPRSLAETVTPERRVVKRTPTARCAKRGK